MPKFRWVRSLMSRPFWCPTTTIVRPSSLPMPLNLLNRSRSLISASRGTLTRSRAIGAEEPQQLGYRVPKLGARHDRVHVTEAEVRLREPEVVRQLLARRLRHDPRAGEGHQRTWLGEED